jgi:hypothetical protein
MDLLEYQAKSVARYSKGEMEIFLKTLKAIGGQK